MYFEHFIYFCIKYILCVLYFHSVNAEKCTVQLLDVSRLWIFLYLWEIQGCKNAKNAIMYKNVCHEYGKVRRNSEKSLLARRPCAWFIYLPFFFFNWKIPILCKAERVEQMFTICFHISDETSRNANKTS